MRLTKSYKSTYKGIKIQASEPCKLGVYLEILDGFYDQLCTLLSKHSRITVVRVDLHLPEKDLYCAKLENQQLSSFIKTIKANLHLSRWGSHKHVAYGWVREVGKTGHGHYHLFIAFKATFRRLGAISSEGYTGIWDLLRSRWKQASGGSISVSNAHTVERNDFQSFEKCFHHLSYMSKVRDKHFGTGETFKRFSVSRLQHSGTRFEPKYSPLRSGTCLAA